MSVEKTLSVELFLTDKDTSNSHSFQNICFGFLDLLLHPSQKSRHRELGAGVVVSVNWTSNGKSQETTSCINQAIIFTMFLNLKTKT